MSRRRQNILQRILPAFLLVAWTAGTGVQWDILQLVAYVQMTASYAASQNLSLAQAADKALTREDPCALCKIVETGRQATAATEDGTIATTASSAQKSPSKTPALKKDDVRKIPLAPELLAAAPTANSSTFTPHLRDPAQTPQKPFAEVPTPPPKA